MENFVSGKTRLINISRFLQKVFSEKWKKKVGKSKKEIDREFFSTNRGKVLAEKWKKIKYFGLFLSELKKRRYFAIALSPWFILTLTLLPKSVPEDLQCSKRQQQIQRSYLSKAFLRLPNVQVADKGFNLIKMEVSASRDRFRRIRNRSCKSSIGCKSSNQVIHIKPMIRAQWSRKVVSCGASHN